MAGLRQECLVLAPRQPFNGAGDVPTGVQADSDDCVAFGHAIALISIS